MSAFIPHPPLSPPRRCPRPLTRTPLAHTILSPPPTSLPPLIPYSPDQSCGFAALIGPSNSGKSTLLNRLVGHKVAIVTPKVQTTRCRISAIATYDTTQVIYLDTPGIFEPSSRLSRAMVKAAWTSGKQADAIIVVLDVAAMFHEARRIGTRKLAVTEELASTLKSVALRRGRGHAAEILVCANKVDAVPEEEHAFLKERMGTVMRAHGLEDVDASLLIMSAKYGHGVKEMVDWVVERMPKGNWLYAEDDLTDMPARLLAAEVTREKAFMVLRQELPYEIAVETTSYQEKGNGEIRITQDILVVRNSQKRIVTGQGGTVIKKIGMNSREELKSILGAKVHLMLTVKVRGKWKDDRRHYQQWGLDYNA